MPRVCARTRRTETVQPPAGAVPETAESLDGVPGAPPSRAAVGVGPTVGLSGTVPTRQPAAAALDSKSASSRVGTQAENRGRWRFRLQTEGNLELTHQAQPPRGAGRGPGREQVSAGGHAAWGPLRRPLLGWEPARGGARCQVAWGLGESRRAGERTWTQCPRRQLPGCARDVRKERVRLNAPWGPPPMYQRACGKILRPCESPS